MAVFPKDDGKIRYGNKIALKHVRSGRHLHSDKGMGVNSPKSKKGKQYEVVSKNWTPHTTHDFWLVLPGLGKLQLIGKPVSYGKDIRLHHVETSHQLRAIKPADKEDKANKEDKAEVALFPESQSNEDDVWIVEYFVFSKDAEAAHAHKISVREDDKEWMVDNIISLRHKATKKVLSSKIELKDEEKAHSEPVQCEVAADMGAIWRVVVPPMKSAPPLTAT